MKEIKFACPVCGQHITALPGTSGTRIECPTCYQKIIVPQEGTGETKLIVSAAKADKPRPPQTVPEVQPAARTSKSRFSWVGPLLVLAGICAIGAAVYLARDKLGISRRAPAPPPKPVPQQAAKTNAPSASRWTLDPAEAKVPKTPVSGELRGKPFTLTRTVLQGGTLSIRQGKGWPPELAIAIPFPAKHGEDLAGKEILVKADEPPPLPKVVLRFMNENSKSTIEIFPTGYLLKLEFGHLENGHIPGSIYIAFPDEQNSFLAGTFSAEVRPPAAIKPKKVAKPETTAP